MNDVLKIAAGVVLGVVILAVLGPTITYVIWVVLPLALALLFSFGVAVVWRRIVPGKKGGPPALPPEAEPSA